MFLPVPDTAPVGVEIETFTEPVMPVVTVLVQLYRLASRELDGPSPTIGLLGSD